MQPPAPDGVAPADVLTPVYAPAREAAVSDQVQPLPGEAAGATHPCAPDALPDLEPGATRVGSLADADRAAPLPVAAARGGRVALLPHPGLRHARVGFGVASRLDDAVADERAASPLAPADSDRVRRDIEGRLGLPVVLEATVAVVR